MTQRPTIHRPARAMLLCALLALGVLLPLLGLGGARSSSAAPRPSEASVVYMPLMTNGGTGTGPIDPPPPPPPPSEAGALFFDNQIRTASASAQVDAQGGMHMVLAVAAPYEEHPAAFYLYCPGPALACDNPDNWHGVRMGDYVDEAMLQLTAAGQPRVLYRSWRESDGGGDFFYAACDANCTDAVNWGATFVLYKWGTSTTDVSDQSNPQRFFALDPQGRPRFVYYDRNYKIEPDHYGVFYAYCDANCLDEASWSQTQIGRSTQYDAEIFNYPSLTFTSQGQPRVFANVFALNDPSGFYMVGCDASCDSSASWGRVLLAERGQGPYISYDIALDNQDRPRVAFYQEALENDGGQQLTYAWCNSAALAGCLDIGSWHANLVGFAQGDGRQPDLTFDKQGRPRIAALNDINDLVYAWCNTACETAQPQWQRKVVETGDDVEKDNPQALPTNCDDDVWTGIAPTLALDPSGNPRIGYDITVDARCYYDDTPGDPSDPPRITFGRVWSGARFVFFPQP